MSDAVLIRREGAVAVVTLNQARRRNALNAELYTELGRALAQVDDDADIRSVILTGGPHFCVGGDLGALNRPALTLRRDMQIGQRIIRQIVGTRRPVVAAVEGNAYGAGFSIAMACDFVVVDPGSTFCAAFGKVGLQPDYGLLWSLPQRVGIGTAREIVMFCEPIPGTEAKALGLADRLVAPGEVLSSALALAHKLAAKPPATLATTKAILSRSPLSLDTMLAWEADTQALLLQSEDFAEGVRAFSERSEATFKGV